MVLAALLALRIWSAELTRFAFVPRGGFEALQPLPARAYTDPAQARALEERLAALEARQPAAGNSESQLHK
jgi:BMFP domain-containing protein YqiC